MSNRRNKEFDTDNFSSDLNKEELFDIYKSFETDDYSSKKNNKKTSDRVKKKITFSTDENAGNKPPIKNSNYNNRPENKNIAFRDSSQPLGNTNFNYNPPGFNDIFDSEHPLNKAGKSKNSGTRFWGDNTKHEQDQYAPETVIITKESPAAKIYAVLAIAVCFVFIGCLIYKNISDKNVPVANNTVKETNSTVNSRQSENAVSQPAASEAEGQNENEAKPEDYLAQMSEVKEPEELKIVNADNPLTSKDTPSLVRLSCMPVVSSSQLETSTHTALGLMYKSMKQDGVSEGLRVYSGYRSYSYQKTKYKSLTKTVKNDMGIKNPDSLEALTSQLFGRAGTSEHQLGTSVDLCIGDEPNGDFLSTASGQWLLKNAYKYGFIFRYSEEKAEIHKRVCEPWHLRYVGVTAAEKMFNDNLSLEEYLQTQQA